MKKKYSDTEIILDVVRNDMKKYGAERKVIAAAALCVEEILYRYAETVTADTEVSVEVVRDTKEFAVVLRIPGADCPEESSSPEFESSDPNILKNIIKYMNFTVSHSHADGMNTDKITIAKYLSIPENLKFTFKYMGENKRFVYIGLLMQVVSIVANLIIPYLSGNLIIAYSDEILTQVIVVAIAITISRCIYEFTFKFATIFYCRAAYRTQTSFRNLLIGELFMVRDETVEEKGAGPFEKMITEDTDTIASGLNGIADMLSESLYYLGVMVAIFTIDKFAFLAGAALLGILVLLERKRAYYLDIDTRKAIISRDKGAGIVLDLINGSKEVKSLNAQKSMINRLAEAGKEIAANKDQSNCRTAILSALNSAVMALCYCFIMLYLGFSIYNGHITAAIALVLFNYFTVIGLPVIKLIQRAVDFNKAFGLACERVRNFVEGSEYPRESFGELHQDNMKGEICFQNVSFAYNHNNPFEKDRFILKGLNLTIKPGEKIAIVGRSGCGKSTMLKLITKQWDCTEGTLTLDGVSIAEYDQDSLKNSISVVNQSPYIFNASVRDNLLYAKPDASQDELESACEKACILEDIQKMPNAFDTLMGEKGIRFSGGQLQRLAIARAFLRDTPILLFDEATSAVDNVAQKQIMDSVNGRHQTIVMIAHRLSTIQNADQIVFLSNGEMIAKGTHDSLLETCKEYRELYFSDK